MSNYLNGLLSHVNQLSKSGKYTPLAPADSAAVRKYYQDQVEKLAIPEQLRTHAGTLIAAKWQRVVYGDYGAYIEIADADIVQANVQVAPGQEYRFKPEFSRCKYYWYTTRDKSGVKLYRQRATVAYADYRPGFWYVAPSEIALSSS